MNDTLKDLFASLQSAYEDSAAHGKDVRASWVQRLEDAIADDPVLCKRYLPANGHSGMGIELNDSIEFTFLPYVSSEYVRVAAEIKHKLSPGLYFNVVDVLVETITRGFSNRGDDEDAHSFLVHMGQRVALPVENHDN